MRRWLLVVVLCVSMATAAVAEPLCGRLLRGRSAADFDTLTADSDRRVVMLMDDAGVRSLEGLSGYQQLIRIGYTPEEIARTVRAGLHYQLAVWPRGALEHRATWDAVIDLVANAYPEVASSVESQRHALKTHAFASIESMAGYHFADVAQTDPRFMSVARLKQVPPTLVNVRAFLYDVVHLRELFAGDGYTRQADGQRGVAEYIMANMPLANIPGLRLTPVDVQLP